jgi:ribosomal protein L13E
MIFDDEAPDPNAGAPESAADRSRAAVTAHPQHTVAPSPRPVSHPPAYRSVVAGWPEDRRERWGRRANELEEAGLSWRDAETQAFVEIWNLSRQERRADTLSQSGSDAERN